jgi:hypothetical protein
MYRSFLFLSLISLVNTAFCPASAPIAVGIAGTWKRTAMTLVEAGGKTTDLNAAMNKSMPCMNDITYTFSDNGQMKSNVPDACGAMKKTIEDLSVKGRWSSKGGKIVITTTMKDFPPATYDVSFQGNTMTWVFHYADNPKTPNPTKAVQLTTVYQRI